MAHKLLYCFNQVFLGIQSYQNQDNIDNKLEIGAFNIFSLLIIAQASLAKQMLVNPFDN